MHNLRCHSLVLPVSDVCTNVIPLHGFFSAGSIFGHAVMFIPMDRGDEKLFHWTFSFIWLPDGERERWTDALSDSSAHSGRRYFVRTHAGPKLGPGHKTKKYHTASFLSYINSTHNWSPESCLRTVHPVLTLCYWLDKGFLSCGFLWAGTWLFHTAGRKLFLQVLSSSWGCLCPWGLYLQKNHSTTCSPTRIH